MTGLNDKKSLKRLLTVKKNIRLIIMHEDLDDIIERGLELQEKSFHSLKYAISSPTTHEKDKIIKQLYEVWKDFENCNNSLNKNNLNK